MKSNRNGTVAAISKQRSRTQDNVFIKSDPVDLGLLHWGCGGAVGGRPKQVGRGSDKPQTTRNVKSADVKNIINWLTIVIVGVNRGNENVQLSEFFLRNFCCLALCFSCVH